MRAFLEKINKEWLDDFVYMSKYPLLDLGFNVIPFNGDDNIEDLLKHEPTKDDIIIGSVEATKSFFDFIGVTTPKYLGYPSSLKKFIGRNITETTIAEIKNQYPFFVKPKNEVKLFTGSLVESDKQFDILKKYMGAYDSLEVFLSDPINIESEYRCFVHKGKLKGIQYYLGDYRIYPDYKVIEEMINSYDNSPIAYTLDVAVTDEGQVVLIEVNDMWAIGSYGFDSKEYVEMTINRLREIINGDFKPH